MSFDDELEQRLQSLDRPRTPPIAFDERLRAELFGAPLAPAEMVGPQDRPQDDVVDIVELDARRAAKESANRSRWIAGALAIAASIAALGLWVGRSDDTPSKIVSGPAPTEVPTVAGACAAFRADAFVDVTRARLVGPDNDAAFDDPRIARRAMERLRTALATLASNLREAPVDDPRPVLNEVDAAEAIAGGVLRNLDAKMPQTSAS